MEEADSMVWAFEPNFNSARLDSGFNYLQHIIDFYEENSRPCKTIKPLLKQSNILSLRGDFSQALEYIYRAQKIFQQTSCPPQIIAEINLASSNLYARIGDYKTADSISLVTINMYEEEWTNKSVLVKLYTYFNGGDLTQQEYLKFLHTGYELAKKNNLPADEQSAVINIAVEYAIADSLDKAKQYLNLALKVALKRNSAGDLATIYNNLAGLSEEPEEKLMLIDSALYYSEIDNNLGQRQFFTQNKAYFEYNQANYQNAFNILEKAFELKDTVLNAEKYRAVAEMEQKFDNEKKNSQITALKIENLNTELEKIGYQRTQNSLLIGILVLLISAGLFAVRFFSIRKNRNLLAQKNKDIEIERQRSDELLLNILPSKIAEELKLKGKAEAQDFDEVSILFTDFKQFTKLAESLSAKELVEEINVCFKVFDHIVEKHEIEKIKTIGDSYMAAGGLSPSEMDLNAAVRTVMAALEMQSFIENRFIENQKANKPAFEMRVGIHTGPIVAGIVGVKKFQYDLWGDTVNTASRIESNGETSKVNISKATYELIANEGLFEFENRGKIEAKGKGEIDMYFVKLKL